MYTLIRVHIHDNNNINNFNNNDVYHGHINWSTRRVKVSNLLHFTYVFPPCSTQT